MASPCGRETAQLPSAPRSGGGPGRYRPLLPAAIQAASAAPTTRPGPRPTAAGPPRAPAAAPHARTCWSGGREPPWHGSARLGPPGHGSARLGTARPAPLRRPRRIRLRHPRLPPAVALSGARAAARGSREPAAPGRGQRQGQRQGQGQGTGPDPSAAPRGPRPPSHGPSTAPPARPGFPLRYSPAAASSPHPCPPGCFASPL